MPSDRFLKLDCDKRNRIKEAAIRELERVPAESVSINRIIQEADISRGSFYQYFDDKEDLLSYILCDFRASFGEYIRESLERNRDDLFYAAAEIIKGIVNTGLKGKNRNLCVNIFANAKIARDFVIRNLLDEENVMRELMLYVDREKLKDDSDEYVLLVMSLGIAVFKDTVAKCFADTENVEKYIEEFEKRIEIIKYGTWL